MSLEPRIRVLELTHCHLDQPLRGCGDLGAVEAAMASQAKFTALRRAMRTAFDRRVDLVVWHAEILSPESRAGRAPWFLGQLIEASAHLDIPVVWVEKTHNHWMRKHVVSLPVTQLVPGESAIMTTRSGHVRVVAGTPRESPPADVAATISVTLGDATGHQSVGSDLVLTARDRSVDHLDDWAMATRGGELSMANLHTTRSDGVADREPLAVSPVGLLRVDCSLSASLGPADLAKALFDEVESASARHLATHPGLELLVVDLSITGQGTTGESLVDRDRRSRIIERIDRLRSETTGPHARWKLRAIHPVIPVAETGCRFTPVVTAIGSEIAGRRLSDFGPEFATVDHAAWTGVIGPDLRLMEEAQRSAIHRLRAAG